ncbi:hypothetical protein STEG23_023982, partial [Scotinomys teguina]
MEGEGWEHCLSTLQVPTPMHPSLPVECHPVVPYGICSLMEFSLPSIHSNVEVLYDVFEKLCMQCKIRDDMAKECTNIEASEMTQQEKALDVKPHNLSSFSGTYMVERETGS